jgi:Fe-S cluster biosynthesis and repair protein YggX
MVLIVDDVLLLPSTIGKIILQTLVQTVEKVAWTEYSRDLRRLLLRARHDLENNKISRVQFSDVEQYVFQEMKVAKNVLFGKK